MLQGRRKPSSLVAARRRSTGSADSFESELFSSQRNTLKSFFSKVTTTRIATTTTSTTTITTSTSKFQGERITKEHTTDREKKSRDIRDHLSIGKDSDCRASKRHKAVRLKQMYLDLGQRDFGKRTICDLCGMLFVHGLSEDAKEHSKSCQSFQDGVPFHSKNARIVAREKLGIIVEIRPSDSYELREKVRTVESIVDRDLGFVVTNKSEHKETTTISYLFVRNKRVVGIAMAKSISNAFVLKSPSERSKESVEAMIGIHKIWVHHQCRKQGVATMLVNVIRSKYVFGIVVPSKMVAFSSPTVAGIGFADQYMSSVTGDETYQILVYDW